MQDLYIVKHGLPTLTRSDICESILGLHSIVVEMHTKRKIYFLKSFPLVTLNLFFASNDNNCQFIADGNEW